MRVTHTVHSNNALDECKRVSKFDQEQRSSRENLPSVVLRGLQKRLSARVSMNQTLTIPETFLGVGYTKNRAGLPLESVCVLVPRPEADQVLIRVAASSLNPLE